MSIFVFVHNIINRKLFFSSTIFLTLLTSSFLVSNISYAATDWSMAGGNPQRNSWTPDEAPGGKKISCVVPIEPYVQFEAQPIVANNKVFVSTAKGLYAFNIADCTQAWANPFATELPLGNSPTYSNGKLYVSGTDRKLYALDATNGTKLWEFIADGPFEVNPLVVDGVVYAGNHDGNMYAIDATTGQKLWNYNVGAQIFQSATYNNNKIFFGAMNSKAYALNIDGTLSWSTPLPVMGWRTFWPVVYQDKIIWTRTDFARNSNYPNDFSGESSMVKERDYLFGPNPNDSGSIAGQVYTQTQPNSWLPVNSKYADLSVNPIIPGNSVVNYLEANIQSRNLFILNQSDGVENFFQLDDDNNDGLINSSDTPDAAPFLTYSGDNNTGYPPVVSGYNGLIYTRNPIYQSGVLSGSMAQGWNYGTPLVSIALSSQSGTSPDWPMDEYVGLSAGGKYLHWSVILGRNIGGVDLSKPNAAFPGFDKTRQFRYINRSQPGTNSGLFPVGFNTQTHKFFWYPSQVQPDSQLYFGHNYQTGPVVYGTNVVSTVSNSLVVFAPTGSASLKPVALSPTNTPSAATTVSNTILRERLINEITKIVTPDSNGNFVTFKPGYTNVGNFDSHAYASLGDNILDYWSNPAETITALISTLPYLDEPLKTQTRSYIQHIYATYPPYQYTHVGWVEGSFRQNFVWPEAMINNTLQKVGVSSFYSGITPFNVYSMYKYAEVGLGDPVAVYQNAKNILPPQVPSFATDTYLKTYTHVLNSYIAGYIGYVKLAQLAQTTDNYNAYITERDRLLTLRKNNWATTPPTAGINNAAPKLYFHTLITGWNFMYMVPELADYLSANILSAVNTTINMYTDKVPYPVPGTNNGPRAPYWFIPENKEVQGENGITPYYQTFGIFQAKALISKSTQTELSKYISMPVTPVGDLFYIQNLVAVLNAPDDTAPVVTITSPSNNSILTNVVSVTAAAQDNGWLSNVSFYKDADLLFTDTSAPYEYDLDTTQFTNGDYTLTAIATDASNNTAFYSINITVDNVLPDTTNPTVDITQPADNTVVAGNVTLTANASDDVALSGVQFKLDDIDLGVLDTEAPYTVDLDTTLYSNSTHTISAVAYDTSGNTSTDQISLTFDNELPEAQITSPLPDETLFGLVTISANAIDNIGISTVQFKLDDSELGALLIESPYTVDFDSTQVTNGAHTLSVVALDTVGNVTNHTINIIVQN